jgi:hypothetical protein
MKIIICETTLQAMQRLTALARATDDVVQRADFYRQAELFREMSRYAPPRLA